MSGFPTKRLRRLRYSPALREMLADVRLDVRDFVAPIFVREGEGVSREIPSMPGQFQFSMDTALQKVKQWRELGIRAVLLFGVTDAASKDEIGSMAWNDEAPVQELTRLIKSDCPEMLVVCDTCLCEYTSHGHCGPICGEQVDNDSALKLLAQTAVSQARAGADIVAPSAMMDGQVAAIRTALDEANLTQTAILSYAVKYASAMYGPFRDAAESPPSFGDRKSHQMDFRDARQAMLESQADLDEGADMLMVKPAATYLDIIAAVRRKFDAPLAAYHVSGEFSQIKAAAANGWIDEKAAAFEITTAIKRAGADIIISYFAEDFARWLSE